MNERAMMESEQGDEQPPVLVKWFGEMPPNDQKVIQARILNFAKSGVAVLEDIKNQERARQIMGVFEAYLKIYAGLDNAARITQGREEAQVIDRLYKEELAEQESA
jgi:hypothetical protein